MANPITQQKLSYTGLGATASDFVTLQYSLAFGIPDFSTLVVYEESDDTQLLDYELLTGGEINVYNKDPDTGLSAGAPTDGTMVLRLDTPADEFVRSINNGNIFKEQTLKDLFTQSALLSGAVSEGRLATLATNLDMGGNKLVNLPEGTQAGDSINWEQLEAVKASIISGKLPDGLYGDLEVANDGAELNIRNGVVDDAKISDVDFSKVSNVSIGTTELEDDSVTGDKLDNTGVTAGTYNFATVTVDENGRVTDASTGEGVPIGSVHVFPTLTSIPSNYLVCDGSTFSSVTYPDLYTALDNSNALPDYRGEFLRGADQGRGVDTGRVIGSAQGFATEDHNHWQGSGVTTTASDIAVYGFTTADTPGAASDYLVKGDGNPTHQPITSNMKNAVVGTETRPRNVAVVYAIKAEN